MCPTLDRHHQEFVAGRAAVGEKVGLGFDGMRLAADQAHRGTAALTKKQCQSLLFFEFDLFHDAHARAHVAGVNSVSLQPITVRTWEFGQTDPFA